MNFKTTSLFTLFFFLICFITYTTSDPADLQKITVISPTDGQSIKRGESISVKYQTVKPDSGETASLHVILLNSKKYQLYQVVADQNLDGNSHEYTVPANRLQSDSAFYIRFHENYKAANSEVVQRLTHDSKVTITS
ncbi:hypothetical protein C1645_814390 [Glomus cerebriforme]|uniref:Dolichyl-diphosphooligosaccharide--protein glycosyltransferase subunit 1 n=1 Tax=Glomus cerebriforme TaxID=658196 RepID=A0A397TIE7_9GLOM|nr:hypothetical protein C1645_814390 [Glomus cerebriforme]